MQEDQSLLSEPFQVHDEADLSPSDRLPFVHLDPDPSSFHGLVARLSHDPLKLPGIFPLFQLRGSQSATYPCIKVHEYLFELLDPEVRYPAPEIVVEVLDNLIHG